MKRELQRIEIPGEHDARQRTWRVVQAAFAERERVTWPRRHARSLVLAAAGAAIVAAAVTPPGRSVVNSLRDAVGREKVVGVRPAHRELVRLPASGRLLLESPGGSWVVGESGSRRRLGPYRMASWSPRGLYVAAILRGFELVALDPKGDVRWTRGRKQRLAFPRWSYEGYRIAYLSESTLRVVTGDGEQDWGLGSADPGVAPAWRPGTHDVAYVGTDGDVRVADADARRLLWRAAVRFGAPRQLLWSADGSRLVAIGPQWVKSFDPRGRTLGYAPIKGYASAATFAPRGHRFALIVRPGGVLVVGADTMRFHNRLLFAGAGRFNGVAWSPDGQWILVSWPSADQFLFVRSTGSRHIVAVANVAEQFNPGARAPAFPRVDGWCCAS